MDIGRVVCSLSGHDEGFYMVVVGSKEKGVLVANGKERKLNNPKLKNIKHLRITEYFVETEQLQSNKSLRKAIYGLMGKYKEENVCQKKI